MMSSMKYGGIGSIIGSQLAYALIKGISVCKDRRSCKWRITTESYERFNDHNECFKQQYEKANKELLLRLPDHAGVLTLKHDLSDNTGLRTAFKAYNKACKEECATATADAPKTCPGNITGPQLFLLSYAKTKCKIADNATLIGEITRPGYSHPKNRVNLAMKIFNEFDNVFKCESNPTMDPPEIEPCTLW